MTRVGILTPMAALVCAALSIAVATSPQRISEGVLLMRSEASDHRDQSVPQCDSACQKRCGQCLKAAGVTRAAFEASISSRPYTTELMQQKCPEYEKGCSGLVLAIDMLFHFVIRNMDGSLLEAEAVDRVGDASREIAAFDVARMPDSFPAGARDGAAEIAVTGFAMATADSVARGALLENRRLDATTADSDDATPKKKGKKPKLNKMTSTGATTCLSDCQRQCAKCLRNAGVTVDQMMKARFDEKHNQALMRDKCAWPCKRVYSDCQAWMLGARFYMAR